MKAYPERVLCRAPTFLLFLRHFVELDPFCVKNKNVQIYVEIVHMHNISDYIHFRESIEYIGRFICK